MQTEVHILSVYKSSEAETLFCGCCDCSGPWALNLPGKCAWQFDLLLHGGEVLSLGLRRVVTSEFRGEPLSGPLGLTRRRNRERLVGYGDTRGSLSTHSFVFIFFIVLRQGLTGPGWP